MARLIEKLSPLAVAKATKSGYYGDGAGLWGSSFSVWLQELGVPLHAGWQVTRNGIRRDAYGNTVLCPSTGEGKPLNATRG